MLTVNERGYRVGEDHHRSKLKNADIEMIFALSAHGLSCAAIAAKFDDVPGGISKRTVAKILRSEIRAQTIAGFARKVLVVGIELAFSPASPDEFDVCP